LRVNEAVRADEAWMAPTGELRYQDPASDFNVYDVLQMPIGGLAAVVSDSRPTLRPRSDVEQRLSDA
jgi:hypothetical protein